MSIIPNSLAIAVLNEALATGGDYAEIYLEENNSQSINVENGHTESVGTNKTYGCGIRILNKLQSVYGYTCDLSKKSLISLARTLAARYSEERTIEVKKISKARIKPINVIEDHTLDVPLDERVAYLKEANAITCGVDPRIVRGISMMSSYIKHIEIFNAEGEIAKHFVTQEERTRLVFMAVALDGQKIESGFAGPGRCAGWNWFKNELDWRAKAKEVSEKALMMLNADECPSGRYTVVISNGWGGVLFHEACGHPLEGSATSKGLSVFSGKIGEQIASPLVSAYDDGTMPNEWGSNDIDHEGIPTHKNMLIKDGICVGYMVDRLTGRRLGMEPNGTCKRQNYRYEPTTRMSNTYIAAGKDDPAQIIKDTPLGIYVANFGGGSVDPASGEFNFSASEAYIIRDGKLAEPVKGCTLIGKGEEILMHIDRVGNDVDLGAGMCGAASGMIPVDVGQPTIRLDEITVGGRGGKLQ